MTNTDQTDLDFLREKVKQLEMEKAQLRAEIVRLTPVVIGNIPPPPLDGSENCI